MWGARVRVSLLYIQSVYIQRVGCLGVLHRPYRIQMGLEGDLGGGGKIGLGRFMFHSSGVSFICLGIGDRGGVKIAVGDWRSDLVVLGVVWIWCPCTMGVTCMYEGTGAGSAQRDVGVVGVNGLSVSGFLFGVVLLKEVMVGLVVSAVSVWLDLRAAAVEVGGVVVVVDSVVVVVGVALNLLVIAV